LKDFNNIKLLNKNVLNMTDEEILEQVEGEFSIVANVPYYITTPLIFRFLESGLPVNSMTLTVQKEVAERLSAKPNTKAYSALTVIINYYGGAKLTRPAPRSLFFPVPDVDSAVVKIEMRDERLEIRTCKQFNQRTCNFKRNCRKRTSKTKSKPQYPQ
jgi:16S rRNA (adenine1518-N6/adenine1519-N6)-dimethyltransferase